MALTNAPTPPAFASRRTLREAIGRDDRARDVARRWREAVAGAPGPTLVACSGGADSTALALCLRSAGAPLVLGHIVHDLRPRHEALADRDAVRDLAAALGVPFAEAEATRAAPGNAEALARRNRYRALANLARANHAATVVTAHHADDQLESIVLALLRGAGPRGLAGVAPVRDLAPGLRLVRPMLGLTRTDARDLCSRAGAPWREDATNLDTSRARNALRHGPLADIAAMRPGAARRAAQTAELLRETIALVEDRVHAAFADAHEWPREALRAERTIVLGAGLRAAAVRVGGGGGADRLSRRVVDPVVRAILSDSTDPRRFTMGPAAVEVDAHRVRIAPVA